MIPDGMQGQHCAFDRDAAKQTRIRCCSSCFTTCKAALQLAQGGFLALTAQKKYSCSEEGTSTCRTGVMGSLNSA